MDRRQLRRTLNVHVPFLSFDDAKMTCDKFFMNSIVGPFDDFADWEDFYSIGNRNPAVARHCTFENVSTEEGTFNFWAQEVTGHRKSLLSALSQED